MTSRPAEPRDLPNVRRLLHAHRLPIDGVDDHVGTMVVVEEEGRLIGSAALEIYDQAALLRSVAVDPDFQGSGIGHQLTREALALARARGVETLYLLTTTAEQFFPRFGFERIDRAKVPESIRGSIEFTSACPSSAAVMRLTLGAARPLVSRPPVD